MAQQQVGFFDILTPDSVFRPRAIMFRHNQKRGGQDVDQRVVLNLHRSRPLQELQLSGYFRQRVPPYHPIPYLQKSKLDIKTKQSPFRYNSKAKRIAC